MNLQIPRALAAAAVLSLCTSLTALADIPGASAPPGAAKTADRWGADNKQPFGGVADGRVGLGQIDEDLFLSVNIGTVLSWWKLGVGIQVPLRFRVQDNDPQQGTVLRKEDWDEVSDWTRVVRFVSWGQEGEWLYARLGVLDGTTLGHGTIVDRYMNVIDADHYQTGLQFELDLDVAGGELFLDNIIDPELFGLRGFVRPFQLWSEAPSLLNSFEVGVTIVVDAVAPLEYIEDATHTKRQVNDDGDLVTTSSSAFLMGFDIGWEWQPVDWFALEPYLDINFLGQTGGTGFHLGVSATFDVASAVKIGTRAEYRAISADYAPSYVNSWYDVERLDFQPNPTGTKPERVTKLDYYRRLDEAGVEDVQHGWHASLDINILDTFSIWGLLEDYQGDNNANLTLGLSLPYIAGIRAQVYYAKRNFDSPSEAFDLDRGLFVADLRYKFWGPMFVYGSYSREWRLDKDEASATFGEYETINDWDTGVGAEFTF